MIICALNCCPDIYFDTWWIGKSMLQIIKKSIYIFNFDVYQTNIKWPFVCCENCNIYSGPRNKNIFRLQRQITVVFIFHKRVHPNKAKSLPEMNTTSKWHTAHSTLSWCSFFKPTNFHSLWYLSVFLSINQRTNIFWFIYFRTS